MAAFDPYYLWLAIPPDQQPAHYYRLLGLDDFEEDPEVLANAADRQIAYVRSFLIGEHAAAAQKLLEELETVRRCVLNPESKSAYDRMLRALVSRPTTTQRETPIEAALPGGVAVPPPLPLPPSTDARGRFPLALAGGVLAAVLFLGMIAWGVYFQPPAAPAKLVLHWPVEEREGAALSIDGREVTLGDAPLIEYVCEPGEHKIVAWRNGFESFERLVVVEPDRAPTIIPVWRAMATMSPKPGPSSVASTEAPPEQSSAVEPPRTEPPPEPPTEKKVAALETPTRPVPNPQPPPDVSPPPPQKKVPEKEPEAKQPPPRENKTSPAPPGPAKKADIPSLARQEEIRRRLEEVYQTGEAKKRFEKIKLARKLVALAKKTDGKPDEQYVLLRTASSLAAEGGDAPVLFEAIESLGSRFDLDLLEAQVDALCQFADEAIEDVHFRELMRRGGQVMDQALARNRFELASQLADVVYQNCLKSAGKTYRKEAHDRRGRVREARERYLEMKPYFEALKTDPRDREAHFALGCWYCFEKDRWHEGFRHLAQGKDEELGALAQRELDSPPRDPKEQIALADAWWELAEGTENVPQEPLWQRAVHWYRQALPRVQGLSRVKVEKRLAEYRLATQPKTPVPQSPRTRPKTGDDPRKATIRGTIHACCDDDFILCVNGNEVLRGGMHRVASQSFQFAKGDVITVRATDVGGNKGFACVIKTETGGIVSGPAWKSYQPRSPDQWAEREQIDRVMPVVPGDARQVVLRMQRMTGIAAPCIWGNGNPCYLVVFVR